jgi:hypothetical protein
MAKPKMQPALKPLEDVTGDLRAGRLAVWIVYRHPSRPLWALGQIDLWAELVRQHRPHAFAGSLEEIRAKLPPSACPVCGGVIERLKRWPVVYEAWGVEVLRGESNGRS